MLHVLGVKFKGGYLDLTLMGRHLKKQLSLLNECVISLHCSSCGALSYWTKERMDVK